MALSPVAVLITTGEGDEKGHHHLGQLAVAEHEEEHGGDGDLGHGLGEDDQGIERAAQSGE